MNPMLSENFKIKSIQLFSTKKKKNQFNYYYYYYYYYYYFKIEWRENPRMILT